LVPLDGSESAMNADYALLIAKQSNAELIAIHAVRTEDAYNERLSLDSDFAFAFNLNFISLMFLSFEYTNALVQALNFLVQFARFSSNCLKNFFVLSSTSLPFASNLSCANVTITSGLLIGYMFKNTHVWRR
jgi:hypothetical protein